MTVRKVVVSVSKQEGIFSALHKKEPLLVLYLPPKKVERKLNIDNVS